MWRVVAVGLVGVLTFSHAQAQVFLGKGSQDWLKVLDQGDEAARRNAAYALGKLGSHAADATGALLRRLAEDKSPKVREASAYALGEIAKESLKVTAQPQLAPGLVKALADQDPLVRRSAAYALGCLGAYGASAQAGLEKALNDSRAEVRQNAAWALGRIGNAGITGLRQAMKDADVFVKRDAATSLMQFSPDKARVALPELLNLCKENSSDVRRAALAVLVKVVNAEDAAAAESLRQALTDQDLEVRRNAALALSNIGGKGAAAAVPILLDALRKGDVELRRQAAAGIRNIGEYADSAVPDLVKVLRDSDEELRRFVALALGGIGEKASSAIGPLVEMIADPKEKSDTRVEAAVSLSRLGAGQAARDAVPRLLQIIEDPAQDSKVRERVVWSLRVHNVKLRDINGVFAAFAKPLSEKANADNRMLRYDCSYMLGVLQGSQVPGPVMDVLLEFLKDDGIQIYVGRTSKVGGAGQEIPTGKANVEEVGKADGRIMAIQALTQIGAQRIMERRDIVQQLQALANTKDLDSDVREGAKTLLKKVN
ncbi:MAG: HEAT repeat domain-containing protein [Gemmataceae bacterium]|nr:HEAT repeat domain-containing protein [Gemmataceae bacterium]MCI0738322.1 HEAT repeat domain-containing protein [Gemmataceae bacterium]